jgi:hypothetical protein
VCGGGGRNLGARTLGERGWGKGRSVGNYGTIFFLGLHGGNQALLYTVPVQCIVLYGREIEFVIV